MKATNRQSKKAEKPGDRWCLPSIPLTKLEFERIRDCAGAVEQLSSIGDSSVSYPYSAMRVIADSLLDIIEEVDNRKVAEK